MNAVYYHKTKFCEKLDPKFMFSTIIQHLHFYNCW